MGTLRSSIEKTGSHFSWAPVCCTQQQQVCFLLLIKSRWRWICTSYSWANIVTPVWSNHLRGNRLCCKASSGHILQRFQCSLQCLKLRVILTRHVFGGNMKIWQFPDFLALEWEPILLNVMIFFHICRYIYTWQNNGWHFCFGNIGSLFERSNILKLTTFCFSARARQPGMILSKTNIEKGTRTQRASVVATITCPKHDVFIPLS